MSVTDRQEEVTAASGNAESDEWHDVAEMRQDPTAHITPLVLRRLLSDEDSAEVKELHEIVFPHLCSCFWCRTTLEQALRVTGTTTGHPAHTLLQEAQEWARYDAVGHAATQKAREKLLEDNIGYIYGKNGAVYAHLSDGSDVALEKAASE